MQCSIKLDFIEAPMHIRIDLILADEEENAQNDQPAGYAVNPVSPFHLVFRQTGNGRLHFCLRLRQVFLHHFGHRCRGLVERLAEKFVGLDLLIDLLAQLVDLL